MGERVYEPLAELERVISELEGRIALVEQESFDRDWDLRSGQELLLGWIERIEALERRPDA